MLAGGGPLVPAATEWPGFTVSGSHLELASAVPKVVPGSLAVVSDQAAGPGTVTVLDVTAAGPVELDAFGRQASVTRLEFPETLPAGRFGRRTSTVWMQSGLLALAPPPPAPVTALSGGVVPLAAELVVAPPAGRMAAITGKPLGLAVAPLGGAYQVTPTATVAVGPPQADGAAVAVDGAGRDLPRHQRRSVPGRARCFDAGPAGRRLAAGPAGRRGPDAVVGLRAGRHRHRRVRAAVGTGPTRSGRLPA